MKELPKIYKGDITKNIDNNKKVCRFKNENKSPDIEEVLKEIFNGIGYPYNIGVIIRTKDNSYDTTLVSRGSKNVVTIDNEVIMIEDIISIEKKTGN